MRVLVAGILGGIVMFVWGAVAHMALGLGNAGMQQPAHEDVAISALHQAFGDIAGVYILPALDHSKWSDKAAMAAYAEKSKNAPYAWVVYNPQGQDMTDMSGQLPRQWASDTLAALALAVLMGVAAFTFTKRLTIAAVAAVFAWLSVLVPYWTWYRFPASLAWAGLVEQVIGWLLAGALMAWWLGRGTRRTV